MRKNFAFFAQSYNEEEKDINEQEDLLEEEAKAEAAVGLESNIDAGFSLKNLLSLGCDLKAKLSKQKTQVDKMENRRKKIITRTKREENWTQQMRSLIDEIKDDVVVVLKYDELDKLNIDVLEKWFAKHKNLFLEGDFFSFFLVNDKMYARYSNSDLWMNPLYTYFSGIYYIKLLRFDESLKYCCMMFSGTSYIKGLAIYYNTLGNYRLINMRYEETYNDFTSIKGYILKEILIKLDKLNYEACYSDILVGRVKRTIEKITNMREIRLDEWSRNYCDNYDIWPEYSDIGAMVIEEIRILNETAISEKNGIIVFDRIEFLSKVHEIIRVIQSRGRSYCDKMEINAVHVCDMYSWIGEEGSSLNHQICYLSANIKVKEVGENRTENYGNILMKIILANLHVKEMQVLILERERGNESFEIGDVEYTGMVFVAKEEYTVAYYVDRGSYQSEGKWAVDELKERARKLGVSVKTMRIERYINVKKDISEIIERYNKS